MIHLAIYLLVCLADVRLLGPEGKYCFTQKFVWLVYRQGGRLHVVMSPERINKCELKGCQ